MRTALFYAITQRVVVISYQRFVTKYGPHLQVSVNFLNFSLLKLGTLGYPEMSVTNCHYSLFNSPEELGSNPEEVFPISARQNFFRMFTSIPLLHFFNPYAANVEKMVS
jgi:hypothetical protein